RVILNNVPMNLVPGTWRCVEPDRYQGAPPIGSGKYADFNTYETPHSVDNFSGGYGLKRYSDAPGSEDDWITYYYDSTNIDASFGPLILAPLLSSETLPSSIANPVWIGQFSGKLVAVAGKKVWYRNADGTWTDTGI